MGSKQTIFRDIGGFEKSGKFERRIEAFFEDSKTAILLSSRQMAEAPAWARGSGSGKCPGRRELIEEMNKTMLNRYSQQNIPGSHSFRCRWRLQSRPGGVPASLSYVIEGNRLLLPGNPGGIRFAFPIGDVVETDDIIIVCLKTPPGSRWGENVYGIDHAGNLRWRIKPQALGKRCGPYTGLSLYDGIVRLHSQDDQVRELEPQTGAVSGSRANTEC